MKDSYDTWLTKNGGFAKDRILDAWSAEMFQGRTEK